jgi:hypothetical protein
VSRCRHIRLMPRIPKLGGIETFKGEAFHSARWRHGVDLRGKRVGALGNGSSALAGNGCERGRGEFAQAEWRRTNILVLTFARVHAMCKFPGLAIVLKKKVHYGIERKKKT